MATKITSYIPPNSTNGICGINQPVKNSEKKPINLELVGSTVSVSPEMGKILELMYDFYIDVQKVKERSKSTIEFSKILKNNQRFFEKLSTQEKAQALFDKYRELTLSKFYCTKNYQTNKLNLCQQIESWIKDADLADKIVREKIEKLCTIKVPTSFIVFALADALKTEASELFLSNDYKPRNLDISTVNFFIS